MLNVGLVSPAVTYKFRVYPHHLTPMKTLKIGMKSTQNQLPPVGGVMPVYFVWMYLDIRLYKKIMKGMVVGKRDNGCFYIGSNLLCNRMGPEDALNELLAWNERNDSPLTPYLVNKIATQRIQR